MGNNGRNERMKSNIEQESIDQQSTKKRKQKEVAIFGNYRNYYGYRIGQDLEEDPRLKVLKKEWFEGKDCLDIGCNSGLMTIAVARNFCCRSMLGVDIDSARIEDAYWTLRKVVRMSSNKMPPRTSKPGDEKSRNSLQHDETKMLTEEVREISKSCSPLQGRDLSDIVSFRKENFIKNWHALENNCYHTILCLSVTKWIHLNWGDDGLITLFAKIWKLLHPGGILILEPQPWGSYYKNRQVSEIASKNYHDIAIHPEDFQDILLDKIGFRMVENLTASLSSVKSGFERPIWAFWK